MSAHPKPPYILALDIGTSGPRAMLFDQTGTEIPGTLARVRIQFEVFPEGGVQIEADLAREAVFHCLDLAVEQAGSKRHEIAGVAMCTYVSNILGINPQREAITPVYTYADTRPAVESQQLRQIVDEEALHQRTGCYIHTSYLPARFRWLAKNHPETFRECWRWISLGEYLWMTLFGEFQVSYSVASWTGMMNRHSLAWDEEMISLAGISPGSLSKLVDLDQTSQGLQPPYAQRWPALATIPWFPAIGDGAAANFGSGCTSADRVAVSLGKTCAVRAVLDTPEVKVPRGLWGYRVDRRRHLLGGALTEGGNFSKWLKGVLKLEGLEHPEDALLERMPGSHGLTFLPLVAGERSPGWNPEARGAVTGLSLATTPLDLLQAGLEGMICRIAQVDELLVQALLTKPKTIASGGAAMHSRFLIAGLADALGRPVHVSKASEASARGAALLALEALGFIDDLGSVKHPVSTPARPNSERHKRYQEMIAQQRRYYQQIFS
jgi:gluconokinase